jgi:hypothetical protein
MTGPGGRGIGVWGSIARFVVGAAMVGSVLYGHAARGWHPVAWLLGLLVFPAVVLAGAWWRAGRRPGPLRAIGPLGHVVNAVVFLALYLTWWYAPAVDVLSDAALLFYGASMLIAAVRGYPGCEVFAVSNWLLRRDDQVGCAPFGPIDRAEARRARRASRRVPVTAAGRGRLKVELLLAPHCPNAPAARAVLTACLRRLGLDVRVLERVGEFASPTILVNGVDVMTHATAAPRGHACRLDVPTEARVLAALHRSGSSSDVDDAA